MYVLVAPHLVSLDLLRLGLSTATDVLTLRRASGDPLHALVGPGCTLWRTPPLPAHIEKKVSAHNSHKPPHHGGLLSQPLAVQHLHLCQK